MTRKLFKSVLFTSDSLLTPFVLVVERCKQTERKSRIRLYAGVGFFDGVLFSG